MPMINEDFARRSKENMSFSDYKEGSATAEYNTVINELQLRSRKPKQKFHPRGKNGLINFLPGTKPLMLTGSMRIIKMVLGTFQL